MLPKDSGGALGGSPGENGEWDVSEKRPEPGELREVNRGQFLRFFGVGAVCAALLASGADGLLEVREARAVGSSGLGAARPGSLREEFEAAAREYGVPAQILMAIGYVNTRWEMPPAEHSEYVAGESERRGVHGVMALVQNPFADTLGLASRLSGIPQYSLKTDRFSNIRGGAALLAEAIRVYERFSAALESGFNKYLEAVAGDIEESISAFTGIGGGMIYARQVLDLMHSGASLRVSDGELVVLEGGALRRLGAQVRSQLRQAPQEHQQQLQSALGRYGSGR